MEMQKNGKYSLPWYSLIDPSFHNYHARERQGTSTAKYSTTIESNSNSMQKNPQEVDRRHLHQSLQLLNIWGLVFRLRSALLIVLWFCFSFSCNESETHGGWAFVLAFPAGSFCVLCCPDVELLRFLVSRRTAWFHMTFYLICQGYLSDHFLIFG